MKHSLSPSMELDRMPPGRGSLTWDMCDFRVFSQQYNVWLSVTFIAVFQIKYVTNANHLIVSHAHEYVMTWPVLQGQ